jgi:rod shape determining protein RodA
MINFRIKITPIKIVVFCLLFLNLLSLFSLYSSLHQAGEFKNREIFYKQILWIIIGWIILIIFSFVNYRLYYDLSLIFYGLNLLLLILVIFFGKKIMGAQRWLHLFGFSFQPSEFSKLTIILILARFFSSKKDFLKGVFVPLFLIMVNTFFIFIQPDLGTALIITFLFFIMGFLSQIDKKYFLVLIVLGIFLLPFSWNFLKSYQKQRLLVFLDPNIDPLGAGYTIIQSKISIGSGKILGKGFLSGTQNQFNFLPERHTDFIFTVIAEEWGFLGCALLLFIYWLILKKILDKTKDLKDPFAFLICVGISSLFFLHVFINIGMTLGILPVVGLPLLFLSYGGTHLVMSFMLVGIFFNICKKS